CKSLERLMDQNYIGRTGDEYNFLTDEEQDIQEEINATPVDTSTIIERIGQIIFGDLYTSKKYRYGKYDFAFDQKVDNSTFGATTGGMILKFLTVATDATEKNELTLMAQSHGEAIIVLDETPYFDSLKKAMQIRKYVMQHNVPQMPKSTQDIIRTQQEQANNYETSVKDALCKAIENAQFYVDGEHLTLKSGDFKSKIEQSLEYLVAHVYSELDLITKNAETDDDIIEILSKKTQLAFDGHVPNQNAAAKIEEYLEMQDNKSLPTSMADIQTRYQAIPYGWREIDIAAVVALLIIDQKVTVKYVGNTIQPFDPKLPDMLRKKSETGRTLISKRKSINASNMKEAREFLRDLLDIMDVPADEDGLVSFIIEKFTAMKTHYEELLGRYDGKSYPDKQIVKYAIELTNEILSQKKDNVALVSALIKKEDDLYDSKDNMNKVEEFFRSQVQIYDAAVKMLEDLHNELDYLSYEEEANKALNRIRLLVVVNTKFDYKCIPELNTLMKQVREGHNRLLEKKRAEMLENVRQCMEKIHSAGAGDLRCEAVLEKADRFYTQQKQRINELESLALLDGLLPPMIQHNR
ncbi:MAG: BREX system P-loop protein BrxC, partial [Ruminococcus sp.]|nr:BREX system P-loop protein BrxC [Ruminococcus sp.]